MRLRAKTTLIVGLSFLALIGLLFLVAGLAVLGGYSALEAEEALRNVERAREALDERIGNLQVTAADWAHWDDAAAYVLGRMPEFTGTDLTETTFQTLDLDVIVLLDRGGRTVYERWVDGGTGSPRAPPAGFAEALAAGSPLVALPSVNSHREGLLVLPDAVLMVAAQPVTDSQLNPPPVGTLVFGRVVDDAEMERLSRIVHLQVRLLRAGEPAPAAQDRPTPGSRGRGGAGSVRRTGRDAISSTLWVKDVTGAEAMLLRVEGPRPIFRQGTLSLAWIAGSLLACCLFSAVVVFAFLSRKVLAPLAGLARDVLRIGAARGASRLTVTSDDEISEVSRAVNAMLDALAGSEAERADLEHRLAQAHKMEAIGTLAGGVAHDFNNLLTVIVGFCDVLEMRLGRGHDGSAEVAQIRKASWRAATLTSQLLAFGRRQTLQPRVLDLNSLVSDTAEMLRRLVGGHIELRLGLEPGVRPVKADASQLEQVILNLGANARDAMPSGGVLTIRTRDASIGREPRADRPGLKPGEYTVCSIGDTGTGMSPEVQARIFEPFFTTKEMGRGTGLGLSVVWGILKQSGGYIYVSSAPGRGSIFDIYLPACREQAGSAPAPAEGPGALPRSVGVLVVEDEPMIRNLVVLALQGEGLRTVEASDGEEALQRIAELGGDGIQLLLSDVVMPRMGGIALAQRLRATIPDLKVLLMSGNAELMGPGAIPPAGMPCLQKPFDRERLLRAVHTVLAE